VQEFGVTRRGALAAAAALPLVCILSSRGSAAEFSYKLATGQDPTHPINTRARQALDRIREASQGRLEIRLFPANQLGSDTDLLSQLRSGGVEFFNLSTSILATFVAAAGIPNTGFAFADYNAVWRAMDGALGDYIRAQITERGIVPVSKIQDNGFRQITTSTRPITKPEDLRGLKIRVPPAPILTSLFSALGAGPTPINFSELYSALQTKIVEGQENPLAIIATTHLNEVQRYCSMTSHVWDGYWILGNRRAWRRLPDDLRTLVTHEFDRSVMDEREDIAKLSQALRQELAAKGLQFNDVDRNSFRDLLRRTSFYKDWRGKFGDQAWALLESSAGALT
jgi:tripartite ATP-independent transporter DctP family solute receptor